jgi:hypothetical protein
VGLDPLPHAVANVRTRVPIDTSRIARRVVIEASVF